MTAPVERYLRKRGQTQRRLHGTLPDGVDQVVVIPVYREAAYLPETLASLEANAPTELERTLVICVVNNPAGAAPEVVEENRAVLSWLREDRKDSRLTVGFVDASSEGAALEGRGGVGAARRLGMDWAATVLWQRCTKCKPFILSLDADAMVDPTYLHVFRAWADGDRAWAAVARYAHRLPEDAAARTAIAQYELYLRCHAAGLRYAGSPYAFTAMGSIIGCTLEAYVTAGGMNRREGGEDFYFLQELAKTGWVEGLAETVVKPSGRPSDRVPFGTGPRVAALTASGGALEVYDPAIYEVLRRWLRCVAGGTELRGEELLAKTQAFSPETASFLTAQGFVRHWDRFRHQAPTEAHLMRQFHRWFDGFRTLKLIHHLRDHGLPNVEVSSAAARIARMARWAVPPAPATVEAWLRAAHHGEAIGWQAGLGR